MTRNEWAFEYTAKALADASNLKKLHHQDRLLWWKTKQSDVISEVKESGLEITESISMEYLSNSSFGGASNARGAQLVVKNDYQAKLNECHMKIREHDSKVKEYDGWRQVLEANPEQRVKLDIDDYLFFFGK